MNHYILNIESSTDVCSVCISNRDEVLLLNEIVGNDHASKITFLIEDALSACQLTMKDLAAVAISNGPGSYTSLRVGVSTAKGICYAMNIPLIAIDTLESLARAMYNEEKDSAALYCPMIDARRMEVYHALYKIDENQELRKIVDPQPLIVDNSSFSTYFSTGQKIVFCGNGSMKIQTEINSIYAKYKNIVCSGVNLPPLSWKALYEKNFVDVAYHTPDYIKAPNITTPKKVF